jgi:hypothetical protein
MKNLFACFLAGFLARFFFSYENFDFLDYKGMNFDDADDEI